MNRETGKLLVIRRGRMSGGLAPAEVECSLSDIVAVDVSERPDGRAAARCELLMQDGSRMPLERSHSRAARKHQAIREQIEGFLRQAPSAPIASSEK